MLRLKLQPPLLLVQENAHMLTTLTPSWGLHLVYAHAMNSPGLRGPGPVEVNVCPDWNVGRLVLNFPKMSRAQKVLL